MGDTEVTDTTRRQQDISMKAIADETVKFQTLLDRPIVIIERERRSGNFGEYDQWLVDTGDRLVYTSPHQRVAAEYRNWLVEHPGQTKRCVITGIPDEKSGYMKYRWETWSDNDLETFTALKEHAESVPDSDQVPF